MSLSSMSPAMDGRATLASTAQPSLHLAFVEQKYSLCAVFSSAPQLTEVTNANSVLPGTLVQALITAVHPSGLNLQILGFFDGTVDQLHLRPDATDKAYKIGKKVKARVLYDFSTTPPRFALALTEHVLGLGVQRIKADKKTAASQTMQEAYPIGTILEAVKVVRLETERGVLVEIDSGALQGFIHVSCPSTGSSFVHHIVDITCFGRPCSFAVCVRTLEARFYP